MTFAAYVVARRQALGKTQKDLSLALHYTQQGISRFEAQDSSFPLELLPELCLTLDCSLNDIERRNLSSPRYEEMTLDIDDLARRLFTARAKIGLSRQQMGKVLGISGRSVAHYEDQEAMPSYQIVEKWGEITGFSSEELLSANVRFPVLPPQRRPKRAWTIGLSAAAGILIVVGISVPLVARAIWKNMPTPVESSLSPSFTAAELPKRLCSTNPDIIVKSPSPLGQMDASVSFGLYDPDGFDLSRLRKDEIVYVSDSFGDNKQMTGMGQNFSAKVQGVIGRNNRCEYRVRIGDVGYGAIGSLYYYGSDAWTLTDGETVFDYGELLTEGKRTVSLSKEGGKIPLTVSLSLKDAAVDFAIGANWTISSYYYGGQQNGTALSIALDNCSLENDGGQYYLNVKPTGDIVGGGFGVTLAIPASLEGGSGMTFFCAPLWIALL